MSESSKTSASKGIVERHVLLSLFRKTGQSRFTRVQRLSVCVSMFALLMVANAMWYETENDVSRKSGDVILLRLGPYSITWHQIYVSTVTILTVYPVVIIVAEMFRRTKRMRKTRSEVRGQRRPSLQLPRCFLVPAWILVFLSIVASSFFCVLYSLEWGQEKSTKWLFSVLLSFLETVLLFDPLMVSRTLEYCKTGKVCEGLYFANP